MPECRSPHDGYTGESHVTGTNWNTFNTMKWAERHYYTAMTAICTAQNVQANKVTGVCHMTL